MTRLPSSRLNSISLSEFPHPLPPLFLKRQSLTPPRLSDIHESPVNEGDFPPNMSSSQCLHSALSSSLYASLSRLHFFCPLFFSCIALSPIPLSRAPRLNQIGRINVAAWLHRYHGHQREQKSITSPLPFHQLSFPSVFVALPPSIFPLFCFTASSSSLSSEYHSPFPSYFNMLPFPFSPSKTLKNLKNRMPSLPLSLSSSTDANPSFPHFLHLCCTSPSTVQDFFDWQQLACQSQGSRGRRGLGSKERARDTRRREKRGIEKDISNSKRRAVFPWQLGFYRNGLAKDAISVKKYLLTLRRTVCTQM